MPFEPQPSILEAACDLLHSTKYTAVGFWNACPSFLFRAATQNTAQNFEIQKYHQEFVLLLIFIGCSRFVASIPRIILYQLVPLSILFLRIEIIGQ